MQRDMDLIRKVILAAEAGPPFPNIDGYTDEAIRYHQMLAIDAGLIRGQVLKDSTRNTEIPRAVMVKDVTWEGHDFIDAVREEQSWGKVKSFLVDAGKQITIETVKAAVVTLFRLS